MNREESLSLSCLFGRNRSLVSTAQMPPSSTPTISTAPRCCLFEDAASISEELIHLSSFMSALGEYLQQWPGPAGSCESGSPGVTHIHTCHTPCYGLTTPLFLLSKTTMEAEWDGYLGHRLFIPGAMGCC